MERMLGADGRGGWVGGRSGVQAQRGESSSLPSPVAMSRAPTLFRRPTPSRLTAARLAGGSPPGTNAMAPCLSTPRGTATTTRLARKSPLPAVETQMVAPLPESILVTWAGGGEGKGRERFSAAAAARRRQQQRRRAPRNGRVKGGHAKALASKHATKGAPPAPCAPDGHRVPSPGAEPAAGSLQQFDGWTDKGISGGAAHQGGVNKWNLAAGAHAGRGGMWGRVRKPAGQAARKGKPTCRHCGRGAHIASGKH